jgi:hypothetical protein
LLRHAFLLHCFAAGPRLSDARCFVRGTRDVVTTALSLAFANASEEALWARPDLAATVVDALCANIEV